MKYLLFVLLLLTSCTFLPVEVIPEMQVCEQDSDCTYQVIDCPSVACCGNNLQPINKEYYEEINCKSTETVCRMICPNKELKCVENVCTAVVVDESEDEDLNVAENVPDDVLEAKNFTELYNLSEEIYNSDDDVFVTVNGLETDKSLVVFVSLIKLRTGVMDASGFSVDEKVFMVSDESIELSLNAGPHGSDNYVYFVEVRAYLDGIKTVENYKYLGYCEPDGWCGSFKSFPRNFEVTLKER